VQDYKKFTAPFVAFGANAITAYILADFIPHYLSKISGDAKGNPFYHAFFISFLSPVNASLASAIFIVLVIWLVMWILYKRKIIIKV
jgi:predicted acyltransferase